MKTANAMGRPSMLPWWGLLMEGIFSLILGFLLVTDPLATTFVVVHFIGFFWLVSGVISIASIFVDRSLWGWKLVMGVLGILAGFAVIEHPLWSTFLLPTLLVTFIGVNGLFLGVIGLIGAFTGGGWGAGILGVVNLFFGIFLLGSPFAAALALPWVYGVMALAGGIFAIIAAFRRRQTETA